MKTILCYIKDDVGRYLSVNDTYLSSINAATVSEIIGLTDRDIPWGYPASVIMENDRQVLSTEKMHTFFEICLFNGVKQLFRSVKTSMIDISTHRKFIHGVSIPVSNACLIHLSSQQSLCLQYFAMGFTHKQISEILKISQKTVEHYLEAVKFKLGCKARSDLVAHAVERGLIGAV